MMGAGSASLPGWQDVAHSPDPQSDGASSFIIKETPGRLHVLLKRHTAAHIRTRCFAAALLLCTCAGMLALTLWRAFVSQDGYLSACPLDILIGWAVVYVAKALIGMTRGLRNKRGSYSTIASDEDEYVILWGVWEHRHDARPRE